MYLSDKQKIIAVVVIVIIIILLIIFIAYSVIAPNNTVHKTTILSHHNKSVNAQQGNTGSGNTSSGNTSSGNTGSGNTGSGNTGSGNTGSGNTSSGNTSPVVTKHTNYITVPGLGLKIPIPSVSKKTTYIKKGNKVYVVPPTGGPTAKTLKKYATKTVGPNYVSAASHIWQCKQSPSTSESNIIRRDMNNNIQCIGPNKSNCYWYHDLSQCNKNYSAVTMSPTVQAVSCPQTKAQNPNSWCYYDRTDI